MYIHLYLPITSIYFHLYPSISIYIDLHPSTFIYIHLYQYQSIHLCTSILVFTIYTSYSSIYIHKSIPIFYSHVNQSGSIYIDLPLSCWINYLQDFLQPIIAKKCLTLPRVYWGLQPSKCIYSGQLFCMYPPSQRLNSWSSNQVTCFF